MKPSPLPPLLAAACAALALAGCAATPPTATPGAAVPDALATPTVAANAQPLTIQVLNTEIAPGSERMIFRLQDKDGQEITSGNVNVGMYRMMGDGQAAKAASGAAAYFGAGQPGGGVWVVYTEFDSSGTWGFEVSADTPAGPAVGRVDVEVAAKPRTPKVGDKPGVTDTPVATGDLASISSDPSPDAGLYQLTVGQAMASGKPTVIYFGSPAHCPSKLCEASLAAVKQVKGQFGDAVNFIHVETRDLANPSQISATAQAWGLPSEPWTFVLDKAGRVNTRLEGGVDAGELGAVLIQKLGLSGG